MNETLVSQTGAVTLNSIWDYLSYLPKIITQKIVEVLAYFNWNVTERWSSMLVLFLSGLLVILGLRVTKPLIKIALIIIGVLLIVGLLIPW